MHKKVVVAIPSAELKQPFHESSSTPFLYVVSTLTSNRLKDKHTYAQLFARATFMDYVLWLKNPDCYSIHVP